MVGVRLNRRAVEQYATETTSSYIDVEGHRQKKEKATAAGI